MSSRTTCEQRTVDADLLAANVRVPQHVVYRAFPAETVVLILLTLLVAGLLRSHAQILRALHDLGIDLDEPALRAVAGPQPVDLHPPRTALSPVVTHTSAGSVCVPSRSLQSLDVSRSNQRRC